ncbi:MAG: hypothetical protein MJB57_11170 [Gemmatimonadetes bacterium]|nr:hypothetical protein [Gemmatimonadota bacterium]
MDRHCLYCDRPLAGRRGPLDLRVGVRIAFDPERERIWTVCDRCHGWSLWWTDDRLASLDTLERLARDRARVLFETERVSLLEVDGRQLVRVGAPPRREEAWWRYGRQLRRRRDRLGRPLTGVGAATYTAVSTLGRTLGFEGVTGDFRGDGDRRVEVLRWRRFGGTAWYGRAPCPSCNSVLIRLFFFKSSDLVLQPGEDGIPRVGMPCQRCDPWTGERTYGFEAPASEWVLRRVLAWHNVSGATQREVRRAVALIDRAGSAAEFTRALADRREQLSRIGRIERIALEIGVNEQAERQRLAPVAVGLEAGWRRAHELAEIIETEL